MSAPKKRRGSSQRKRMTTAQIVAAVVEQFNCLGGRKALPAGTYHSPMTVHMYMRQPAEFRPQTSVPDVVKFVAGLIRRT